MEYHKLKNNNNNNVIKIKIHKSLKFPIRFKNKKIANYTNNIQPHGYTSRKNIILNNT